MMVIDRILLVADLRTTSLRRGRKWWITRSRLWTSYDPLSTLIGLKHAGTV